MRNYIKSDTYENFFVWRNRLLNDEFLKTNLKEEELNYIIPLFDHFQVCPNARFDCDNGDIYFSISKYKCFSSLFKIKEYINEYKRRYPDPELSIYFVEYLEDIDQYKVKWGILEKSL